MRNHTNALIRIIFAALSFEILRSSIFYSMQCQSKLITDDLLTKMDDELKKKEVLDFLTEYNGLKQEVSSELNSENYDKALKFLFQLSFWGVESESYTSLCFFNTEVLEYMTKFIHNHKIDVLTEQLTLVRNILLGGVNLYIQDYDVEAFINFLKQLKGVLEISEKSPEITKMLLDVVICSMERIVPVWLHLGDSYILNNLLSINEVLIKASGNDSQINYAQQINLLYKAVNFLFEQSEIKIRKYVRRYKMKFIEILVKSKNTEINALGEQYRTEFQAI